MNRAPNALDNRQVIPLRSVQLAYAPDQVKMQGIDRILTEVAVPYTAATGRD